MPGNEFQESLRKVAEQTAWHATRAQQAVDRLRAFAQTVDADWPNAQLARTAAHLLGIPTRHRQMRLVVENIAHSLESELTRVQVGGGKVVGIFAPQRDVAEWREANVMPAGTYPEVARTLSLACDEAPAPGPAEYDRQLARCTIACTYQATLVESIAEALLKEHAAGEVVSLFNLS